MPVHLGIIQPHPPYDFAKLLDVLSRYAYPTTDIAHHNAYRRLFRLESGLALVEITQQGTVEKPHLAVDMLAQQGNVDHDALLVQVRHVLALDTRDRAAFFSLAEMHPAVWQVVEPVYGLPALKTPTVFEALICTIIEQQIMWTAAQRAQRWLVEWGRQQLHYNGQIYFAFPLPQQIAIATLDALKPLKITHRRIQLLIDIAQAITQHELHLDNIKAMPHEERYKYLLKIKGVGPWTATVTLDRAFGKSSRVAANDVALQAAVKRYFNGGHGTITAQHVEETFGPLGEWAGTAAFYTLLRWVVDQYPRTN